MNRAKRLSARLPTPAACVLIALAISAPALAQQSSTHLPFDSDAAGGNLAADVLPELTVVADHGGQQARPYYVAIGMAGVPESEGYVATPQQSSIGESDMLPVESESLTPGRIEARPLELPAGITPFFLVGDDELSIAWLEQRGDILRSINAVGLIVNVQNESGLARIRNAAPDLELRPVSGNDLAGRVGLSHYPVLVTPTRIEQ